MTGVSPLGGAVQSRASVPVGGVDGSAYEPRRVSLGVPQRLEQQRHQHLKGSLGVECRHIGVSSERRERECVCLYVCVRGRVN